MAESSLGIPNFEGGQVVLSTGDSEVLRVNLSSTHINVDVEDKAFIKRIIAMRDQLTPKMPGGAVSAEGRENLPQIGSTLSTARMVADALCSRGITVTFSYKNHRIATIGAEAHPILLQHITKTRGIALNSVLAAIRMLI
jgi:hypothetical protein